MRGSRVLSNPVTNDLVIESPLLAISNHFGKCQSKKYLICAEMFLSTFLIMYFAWEDQSKKSAFHKVVAKCAL